jgi:hypothetical protein
MNADELAEATKDLCGPIDLDADTEPMTDAERAEWARHVAERGRGRPKIGAGAVRIPISLEGGLAERLDEYARRTGMKRSQVIARALERLLSTDAPVVMPKRRPAAG